MLAPWKKSYNQPRQHVKKQRHYFAGKGPYSQRCGFSSSPLWMWELDHKESWAPKNWCFWTVVLEKTLDWSNQSILKESFLGVHWKDWYWSWNSNTLTTWWEELTHLKRPWCWERLKAEEEGDRGVSSSHQVAKVLEFQLQYQSFQWTPRQISFRMDCFDLLAVQRTLKSLLQHHSSEASILWCSAFFMVQLSHP